MKTVFTINLMEMESYARNHNWVLLGETKGTELAVFPSDPKRIYYHIKHYITPTGTCVDVELTRAGRVKGISNGQIDSLSL